MNDVHERENVVCIGVFDGVHRGHQAMIERATAESKSRGVPLIAMTFDPHPLMIVRPEAAPRMLATLRQRADLLMKLGVDEVQTLNFTHELAHLSPEKFASEVLVNSMHARCVVVGENFTFGRGAEGTVETLVSLGERYGFSVVVVPLLRNTAPISSSRVRGLVANGDVAAASELLGYPFRLEGSIVIGDQRGRELGYPTANLTWDSQLIIPADGIYAGYLIDHDSISEHSRYPAAISIGTNPQFDGAEQRIEAYVLDRSDLDLYTHRVEFEFVTFIRPQRKFSDLQQYLAQMPRDVGAVKSALT